MTTPAPLPTTAITAILLADGIWHLVTAGTLVVYTNPLFTSLVPGEPPFAVGGLWLQMVDSSNSLLYGAPIGEVKAVQFTAQPGQ